MQNLFSKLFLKVPTFSILINKNLIQKINYYIIILSVEYKLFLQRTFNDC